MGSFPPILVPLRLHGAELGDVGLEAASGPEVGPGSTVIPVKADSAQSFDLVPLDQGAGYGVRVMVHARDCYGNLDEECEREVVVELDELDMPEGVVLPDGGLIQLSNGTAELTGIRPA